MKKLITICAVVTMILAVSGVTQAVDINYGNVTYSPGYAASNYSDVWNLMTGDLKLTYSIDLSGVTQTAANETPYVEVGLREVGAGNFNPGPWDTYQGGKGGWMCSLVGDLATNPNLLDLDDKHNLSASGGRGESDYDVYAANPTTVVSPPFGNFDTKGFWFDRDGVDPYQNADAANTGGTYDIEITYHAINAGLGSMIAKINGNLVYVDQEFRIGGVYTGPAGLSFKGDMTQMQVFTGAWYTAGAGGSVGVSDITATGTLIPEPATICLLGLGGLALLRKHKK